MNRMYKNKDQLKKYTYNAPRISMIEKIIYFGYWGGYGYIK